MLKTSNGYTINALSGTPDDCEAVLQVYRQCEDFLALGPVPDASLEMVRADFAISRGYGCTFCGIYSPSGEIVGIVDYSTGGHHGSPQTAFLDLLMIAESHRGHGLGAQVFAAIEAQMRANHARVLESGVQVNNPSAVRFWQRMGFVIASGPELMADGTTCYQLRKEL